MKHKTAELAGPRLARAVAIAAGYRVAREYDGKGSWVVWLPPEATRDAMPVASFSGHGWRLAAGRGGRPAMMTNDADVEKLASFIDLPRPADAAKKAMIARLTLGLDEVVGLAITRRIGHPDWPLTEVIRRMIAETFDDGRTVWLLDDEPILETWPPEVDLKANSMTTKRNYRFLGLAA